MRTKIWIRNCSKFSPIFRPKSDEEQKTRSSLKFSPIFRPKSGEEQKKRSSLKCSPIFRPKSGEEQKKKGFYSNLVRFLAQILKEAHRTCPLYDQTLCPTCKGRAMPQFCLLFYAILQSWRPKGEGPWHNGPPPKYAPAQEQFLHLPSEPLLRLLWSQSDYKVSIKRILDQCHAGTALVQQHCASITMQFYF